MHEINNSIKYYFRNYLVSFLELERAKTDPKARLKKVNLETKEALAELEKTYKPSEIEINAIKSKVKADKLNAASYSTGAVAASFTSTGINLRKKLRFQIYIYISTIILQQWKEKLNTKQLFLKMMWFGMLESKRKDTLGSTQV